MSSDLFEQKLREKVSEARRLPSPKVWQALESQLQPPPRARRPLFWWWTGGGGLLAATLLVGWMLWPAPGISPSVPAEQASTNSLSPLPPVVEQPDQEASVTASTERLSPPGPLNQVPIRNGSQVSFREAPRPMPAQSSSAPTPTQPPTSARPAGLPLPAPPVPMTLIAGPAPQITATTTLPLQRVSLHAALTPISPVATAVSPKRLTPWSVRLSVQREIAGRGPLRDLLAEPGIDHSVLETNPLLIRPNEGQVYTLLYPRESFAVNLGVGLRLSRRWELLTGVGLMNSEQGQLQRGTANLLSLSEGPVSATEAVQQYDLMVLWRQRQLEIPLSLRYQVLRIGRHELSAAFGVAADRSWRGQISSFQMGENGLVPSASPDPIYDEGGRGFITPEAQNLLSFRAWHAHLQSSLWYSYQVMPQWQVYLGPTVKYHLRGAYEGVAARDQMRYRVGMELGLRFGQ